MQTTNKIDCLVINQSSITTKLQEQLLLTRLEQGDTNVFWQLWQPHQNYLYYRCLTWMGGNHTDAEEVLSLATLKAWQKLPNYAGKITNLRAWLTRLTHNLCVDIHRERSRKAIQMESLEEIAVKEEEVVISSFASPELALLNHELRQYINRAINTLPPRLRTPFILRYYQQIPYQDIAQKLAISQNNVYKRIQQARDILQKRLRSYLSGLNDSVLDSSPLSEKSIKCVVKSSPEDEAIASDFAQIETINYQVIAICLETVPRWYCSLSPLGWS